MHVPLSVKTLHFGQRREWGAVGVSDGIPLFITGQAMYNEAIILALVNLLQIIWIDYNIEGASMQLQTYTFYLQWHHLSV